MYFYQFLIKLIVFIFTFSFAIASVKAANPKIKLFEILGLSENVSIDETLFDLLVKKLEELGIEEEELSDGYEFMGGSSALNNYINKNAKRLVILLGGEIEDDDSDESYDIKEEPAKNEEFIDAKKTRFLFEEFENIETKEKQIENIISMENKVINQIRLNAIERVKNEFDLRRQKKYLNSFFYESLFQNK